MKQMVSKKVYKKWISGLLAALLLMSMSVVTVSAYASGTGTQADPYLITSAKELQNVNSDLSASYKLAADIDLKGVDFVPLGNVENGAFTGTFDGNGFTIFNLDMHAGKYAGLFGCNEGTIKNVTLDNIYVYGNRYLGGVCGQNTKYGTVENCTVLGGLVTSDGGIEDIAAGGIIGQNDGQANSQFVNSDDVNVKAKKNVVYAGGIIGNNRTILTIEAQNFGNICSSDAYHSYCGGIIGCNEAEVKISNSRNSGNITAKSARGAWCGGLLGDAGDNSKICYSSNTGNIYSCHVYSHYITSYSYTGGIVGKFANGVITNSMNAGSVTADYDYVDNVSYFGSYVGGIIGYSGTRIENCYNTGLIKGDWSVGGIAGYSPDYVRNCYNSGSWDNLGKYQEQVYSGGIVTNYRDSETKEISDSYTLFNTNYLINDSLSNGEFCTVDELKQQNTFNDWDFENVWQFDENVNNGFPTL